MILYYVSCEDTAEYIAAEKKSLALEIVTSLVFDDGAYFSLGVAARRKADLVRYRASNLPLHKIEEKMRPHLRDDYTQVEPNE